MPKPTTLRTQYTKELRALSTANRKHSQQIKQEENPQNHNLISRVLHLLSPTGCPYITLFYHKSKGHFLSTGTTWETQCAPTGLTPKDVIPKNTNKQHQYRSIKSSCKWSVFPCSHPRDGASHLSHRQQLRTESTSTVPAIPCRYLSALCCQFFLPVWFYCSGYLTTWVELPGLSVLIPVLTLAILSVFSAHSPARKKIYIYFKLKTYKQTMVWINTFISSCSNVQETKA